MDRLVWGRTTCPLFSPAVSPSWTLHFPAAIVQSQLMETEHVFLDFEGVVEHAAMSNSAAIVAISSARIVRVLSVCALRWLALHQGLRVAHDLSASDARTADQNNFGGMSTWLLSASIPDISPPLVCPGCRVRTPA